MFLNFFCIYIVLLVTVILSVCPLYYLQYTEWLLVIFLGGTRQHLPYNPHPPIDLCPCLCVLEKKWRLNKLWQKYSSFSELSI